MRKTNKNVWMRATGAKDDMLYRDTTAEDGQYVIDGLPPGDYRLRADEDISRAITIAGDAVLNIDIPSVQLSARVLEDGGAVGHHGPGRAQGLVVVEDGVCRLALGQVGDRGHLMLGQR